MDGLPPESTDMAGADDRIARLERENAKLRKINQALMGRVERSMDFQGNAFTLFQTAIVLEGRVRDRTEELENAFRELERINRALCAAKEEAETARIHLAEAIESVNEGFVLWDADDRLVLCNRRFRDFWPGIGDIIQPGIRFVALFHRAQSQGVMDDFVPSFQATLKLRQQSGLPQEQTFVVRLCDGRWVQASERRTRDGGSVAIYTDITEIKRSEERYRERALAEKSRLLQAIFDSISQGISVIDPDRHLTAWNHRFAELMNIDPAELEVGKPIRDLLHVPALRRQFTRLGADMGGDGVFCMEQISEDGRVLEIRLAPMPNGGTVSTYTDITDRKYAEWALRDSEHRLRLVTDAIPALIAYVDAGQRYRFTNKPYEEWFGRSRSEINGRQMRDVLNAEDYEVRRPHVERALAGEHVTVEIRMPTRDRPQIEHVLATYVPHFGENGEVLGFFALLQDITERKRAAEQLRGINETLERRVVERTAELTEVNSQLQQEVEDRRQAEEALRLAKAEAEQANMSKTKFLAAASHDLLQPLNAARVFLAALGESRMADRNRSLVNNVSIALNAVDDLLSALLDISKLDAGSVTPVISDFRLDDLLRSLADMHSQQAKARGLRLTEMPMAKVVRSDAVMLTRVLRNFLSNAMRYTPTGGRILMGCRRHPDGVEVQVWDSGIGIPPESLAEIFEEFRRLSVDTHGHDRGMGLGLAIVQRMARQLGHRVVVRSVPGKGSMFGVVLPLGNPRAVQPKSNGLPLPTTLERVAQARVVVIENEPAALEAMGLLLGAWQCKVISAARIEDVISQLRGLQCRPDVLVADYHLDDGRTGLEALAAIRALYEQPVPGIVVTADRTDDVMGAIRDAGYHILNKPLKPARLRSLLAHLIRPDP